MALEGSRKTLERSVSFLGSLLDIVPLCQLEPGCQGEIELSVHFLVFMRQINGSLEIFLRRMNVNIVDLRFNVKLLSNEITMKNIKQRRFGPERS